MQNRSRSQIVQTILEIVSEPVNQTSVMYRANLSFTQLGDYLKALEQKKLIEHQKKVRGDKSNSHGKIVITAEGRKVLENLKSLPSL